MRPCLAFSLVSTSEAKCCGDRLERVTSVLLWAGEWRSGPTCSPGSGKPTETATRQTRVHVLYKPAEIPAKTANPAIALSVT